MTSTSVNGTVPLKVAYEGGMCGDGFSTFSNSEKEQHRQYLIKMGIPLKTEIRKAVPLKTEIRKAVTLKTEIRKAVPELPPPVTPTPVSWKSRLARYFGCFSKAKREEKKRRKEEES